MLSLHLCRLRQEHSTTNNCISLLSKWCEHENWMTRISTLLCVAVSADDSLPLYFCMRCCRHAEGLEKAVRNLQEFQQLASTNYHQLLISNRLSLKWPKDTSTSSVTPETAKTRPSAKKYSCSKRLGFGQCLSVVGNVLGNILCKFIYRWCSIVNIKCLLYLYRKLHWTRSFSFTLVYL